MVSEIAKLISIYFFTMLKFIAGPTLGIAAGFSVFETVLITVLGMMTSVFVFSYFGRKIKDHILVKLFPKRKKFTSRNRRFVYIWKKYGLAGVSFLTPIIFTPIGGAILASAMESSKRKIFVYMFISAAFWSVLLSHIVYFLMPGLFLKL